MTPAASGVASVDIDGYLSIRHVDAVSRDYLLLPAEEGEANVVLHVVPDGQRSYPESRLRLATDLADQRGPREEARAAELLRQVAVERQGLSR